MGLLASTVISSASAASRPALQSDRCLNRKQNKFTCTACSEICPEHVISLNAKEELKWSRCRDCGLCVSACPSRCFTPSSGMQRTLTEDTHPGEPLVFACEQESELMDRKIPCLAAIPWELLALMAFYGEVVLLMNHCASCGKAGPHALLLENLAEAKAFLGEERFHERIRLMESGTWEPETSPSEKEMSRRAIFSGLKKNLKKNVYRAAVSRIPQLEEADRDGLRYRRLLAQAVRAERDRLREAQQAGGGPETLPTYPMSLPAYTTACFGCSICERICPQQALEIRVEEGGTRLICITPWKCTACGLCVEICPHGGLQGLEKIAVPFLEQLPLARVPTESCEQCGVAIQPGTAPALCPSCRAKKKRLRR